MEWPGSVEASAAQGAYALADLSAFVSAAESRAAELHEAIASFRDRKDRALGSMAAVSEIHQRLGAEWAAAQHEADTIRAAADAEVASILRRAELDARAMLGDSADHPADVP